MLVFGVISPHPPIIIPSIGGRETRKAANTISALNTAARQMADARPERVIIISPHPQHGYEVPLFYLGQHFYPDIKRDEILVTNTSY